MRMPWTRRRSDSENPGDSHEEEGRARARVDSPEHSDPSPPVRRRETGQGDDGLVTDGGGGELPDGSQPRQVIESVWWQFRQGAESVGISVLAATVVIIAHLVEPGHMKTWHVFGIVPLYFVGVVISFRTQRSEHRKRRANLPLDVSGGGRFVMIFAAIVLCGSPDPATDGLGGRLALAALLLGSVADGTWIAIISARRRIGFWDAWYELVRKQREAQGHYWSALIGRDER
ncbi:MAG: hypothetical protein OYH76_01215 [Defluviicoccus sp.]|nr:hypothetical protein [Defluviicoccus sp.]